MPVRKRGSFIIQGCSEKNQRHVWTVPLQVLCGEEGILANGCLVQDAGRTGHALGKIISIMEKFPNSCARALWVILV